jgi:hypothetical protein
MFTSRGRRPALGGIDLRAHVRRRLEEIRTALIERNGSDSVELMGRSYRLERLDELEAGLPVIVTGFEIRDALPRALRDQVDTLAHYTLGSDGRLTPCQ